MRFSIEQLAVDKKKQQQIFTSLYMDRIQPNSETIINNSCSMCEKKIFIAIVATAMHVVRPLFRLRRRQTPFFNSFTCLLF